MCGMFVCLLGLFIGYIFSDFNHNIDAEQYDAIVANIQSAEKQDEDLIAMFDRVNNNALEKSFFQQLPSWRTNGGYYESPCLSMSWSYMSSHKRRLVNNNYIVAYRLEKEFSQEDCLHCLLENTAYGYEIRGVKNAAEYYFQKPINELSEEELIGLLVIRQASSTYNPKVYKDRYDRKVSEIKERIGL